MMQIKIRRWYRVGLFFCMSLLWLTACSQSGKDGMRPDKSGSDKKENKAPAETPAAGGLFGNGYSDASYQYGNSTNLYKNFSDSDTTAEETSAKEKVAFVQYDLEGKHVQDISLVGGAWSLLSVDDSWLYYTAWRKAWNKEQTVICRLPVTKKDGIDVIDTSKEEILLAPEHLSDEEKRLGISEKDVTWSDCYITPTYVVCIIDTDAGEDEQDVGKEEIIRYHLQSKEYTYKLYSGNGELYGSAGAVSASGDTIVIYGEDGVYLLDVDSLTVSTLSEAYCEEPSHVLVTADRNTLCYLTESYDDYEYEDEYDGEDGVGEITDVGMTVYSLEKKCLRTVMPPKRLLQEVCQAEGAEENTVYNTAYDFLGSYRDKIYLRYLFEQKQEDALSAHYGVLSLSLSDWKFSYEKEISEAVQGESVPFHGQWIRYQKVSKQEKKAAKKEGRKPKKSIDAQYALTVNLGNPQRVIGNQLFFRSINQDMEQNGWFCYCLDTNKYERLTAEDARNEWIYLQSNDGWDELDTYLSATEEMLCTDNYDDDDLVNVVWDAPQAEASATGKTAADSGQKISKKEQLQYIAAHRYDWMRGMVAGISDGTVDIDSYDEIQIGGQLNYANYQNGLKYIVTDLNRNGRLEVIVLDQTGSGGFTNICAYEYSYTTRSLQSVGPADDPEWWTVPDIGGLKKTDVYYDKKKKMHWYFGKDYTHTSGEENYDALCLWGIDGKGVFRDRSDAHKEFSFDVKKPVRYYIGDNKVSKEEFQKKRKNMEPDMKKGKATLCWQQNGRELVEMSEEEMLEKLTKSWKGFSVKY